MKQTVVQFLGCVLVFMFIFIYLSYQVKMNTASCKPYDLKGTCGIHNLYLYFFFYLFKYSNQKYHTVVKALYSRSKKMFMMSLPRKEGT